MQKSRALLVSLILLSVGRSAIDPAALQNGVELVKQRKWTEAQQAFEALERTAPDNPDVLYYLGRLALHRKEYEKAATILEKAATLAPTSSPIQLQLGDAYGSWAQKASMFSQLGLAKQCRAAYEKAVELDPKNVDARLSLMSFYQQAPGFVGGGLDKAHVQADEIKKLDANRGRQALAGLYLAEKKYPEAFAEFDEVLKEKPDDYAALFQFGRLAALSGERLDQGLAALRRCLEQTPPENQPGHAAAHWRTGNILEKKGDKAGARAEYETALKVDPKFPQAIESLKKL
ncbi:MAG TPA: tetratricopeptide repeat protein [Lacunisphaera sp.]